MAKIVYGAGVSHSPMLTLDPSEWEHRSQADFSNQHLNTSDGRFLTYPQLEAEVGAIHAEVAKFEVYREKAEGCQVALDRIAKDLADAAPDVVLIIGDDQRELFTEANQPSLAIFHGDTISMTTATYGRPGAPDWIKAVAVGYAMDQCYGFPGAPGLALEVIQGLMDRGFDVGSVARVSAPEKAGFGHAYGFIIRRLFGGRNIPVLPVLLNTYYEPNVPSAARCYDLGCALRDILEGSASDFRVAVVASGGLSHFIVDETLDRRILDALAKNDGDVLRSIPRGALNSGSSEILNWVTVAGAMRGRTPDWMEYFPVYRTPAGTGVGVAFAAWQASE